jgi:hypothetical protein
MQGPIMADFRIRVLVARDGKAQLMAQLVSDGRVVVTWEPQTYEEGSSMTLSGCEIRPELLQEALKNTVILGARLS